MSPTNRFSDRHGYSQPEDVEIKIREDAPDYLRWIVPEIARESGLAPNTLRTIICRILLIPPDPNNWSEYPNIKEEVDHLCSNCEWFYIYDFIEEIYKTLENRFDPETGEPCSKKFEEKINLFFRKKGIGWQLLNGKIEFRGPEIFEDNVRGAINNLGQSNRNTAKDELHEALKDLSRRPKPDLSGAIQHSMAALECVARDVTGLKGSTLGDIIRKRQNLIPTPLDKSVEKAWGFASEMGRHIREGRTPNLEEAELVVGIAGTLCTYLVKKFP